MLAKYRSQESDARGAISPGQGTTTAPGSCVRPDTASTVQIRVGLNARVPPSRQAASCELVTPAPHARTARASRSRDPCVPEFRGWHRSRTEPTWQWSAANREDDSTRGAERATACPGRSTTTSSIVSHQVSDRQTSL